MLILFCPSPKSVALAFSLLFFETVLFAQANQYPRDNAIAQQQVETTLSALSPNFLENKGQWSSEVKFLFQSGGMDMWITDHGLVYDVHHDLRLDSNCSTISHADPRHRFEFNNQIVERTGQVVRMEYLNASSTTRITGTGMQEGISNYFFGNDSTKWITNVHAYSGVTIENLYPGIDAVYYIENGMPRYDLRVKPRANLADVEMQFEGQDALLLDGSGRLTIKTSMGNIEEFNLYAYQFVDGQKKHVACEFAAQDEGRIAFAPGEFDRARPLIIDPLVYSTYLGSNGDDYVASVAVDRSGDAYVVGLAGAKTFPITAGAYNTTAGGGGFVAKLNPTATALIYSTYLGWSATARGVAIDDAGDAYVTGQTMRLFANVTFPTTPGAFQATINGGSDAFVTKLNPAGNALIYSTCFGGDTDEYGVGIAIDRFGNAYIAGTTQSGGPYPHGIPISTNALQAEYHGKSDVFVAKLNPTGTSLIYSTYLGGEGTDFSTGIALDDAGHAIVTGYTQSRDTSPTGFPITPGSFQTTNFGLYNAFVSKLNLFGTGLIYSTYLGGYGGDYANAIAVDGDGDAFVAGFASSTFPSAQNGFPTTPGTVQARGRGGEDAFVSKLNPTGTALIFSTLLGGTEADYAGALTIDKVGHIFVAGSTTSTGAYPDGFPTTPGAFQTHSNGPGSVFLSELNASGSVLLYSTFIGGKLGILDDAMGLAVDSSGSAYVVGYTEDQGIYPIGFPTTPGVIEDTYAGGKFDAFVTKFSFPPTAPGITLDSSSAPVCGTTSTICKLLNLTGGSLTIDSAIASSPFQLQSGQLPLVVPVDTIGQFTIKLVVLAGGTYTGLLKIFYRTADGTAHDTTMQLASSSTGGGGEVASTVNAGIFNVAPLSTVDIPLKVRLSSIRSIDTMQVEQITFKLTFDSDILDMSPSKFLSEIVPPAGLLFASAASSPGLLIVTYENPAGTKLTSPLDLGHMIFTVHLGPAGRTLIHLSALTITTSAKDYYYCTKLEGDFLANVIVKGSGVSAAATGSRIRVYPNPASSEDITIELTSTQLCKVEASLLDILGKDVGRVASQFMGAGTHRFQIPASGLAPGSYYSRIVIDGVAQTRKMVIR